MPATAAAPWARSIHLISTPHLRSILPYPHAIGRRAIAFAYRRRPVRPAGRENQLAVILCKTARRFLVPVQCQARATRHEESPNRFYLAEDLVRAPLAIHNGLVALPGKPGVGVEIDEAAVARLRVG